MYLPWLLEEAGPAARSAAITIAPSCVAGPNGDLVPPTAVVNQTRSAVRIRVFVRHPERSRLGQAHCGGHWELAVRLPAPIDGRRIEGQSWPSQPHFGSLRGRLRGLPRLLGLAPGQALRVLRLEGFHARLTGAGREVVSQFPGWGLVNQRTGRPDPYDGVAMLRAGHRVAIPTRPALRPGTRSGVLLATGASPVVLFDARGRLLARFRVSSGQSVRLRLAPGRYLLIADDEAWISCGSASARVRVGQVTRVTVPGGCDSTY
jgi:hypothetical protein